MTAAEVGPSRSALEALIADRRDRIADRADVLTPGERDAVLGRLLLAAPVAVVDAALDAVTDGPRVRPRPETEPEPGDAADAAALLRRAVEVLRWPSQCRSDADVLADLLGAVADALPVHPSDPLTATERATVALARRILHEPA